MGVCFVWVLISSMVVLSVIVDMLSIWFLVIGYVR